MNEDERTLLIATITEGTKAPLDQIERLGNRRTYILLSAAMFAAIEQSFAPETTPDQIRGYIEELYERFPKARGELKAEVVEAIIRGGLGEEELLKPLTYEDTLAAAHLVTFDLMTRANLDDAAKEEFIREVYDLANED
ncbi:hypothetical protein Afil01_54790 [Actinorhabdospora filicis]|uniref:Uncharacterized protein n=1 Tax=Actinorhabdospora filicis TaxID=1785913 RepID=A0A9W6SRT9_9ACTN|nr:hypothetical protein [Actinorhabdospora filicis]GLZ80672.1 hypothetical protein Afil01_54790 [Actinorhabdospora filicis]